MVFMLYDSGGDESPKNDWCSQGHQSIWYSCLRMKDFGQMCFFSLVEVKYEIASAKMYEEWIK